MTRKWFALAFTMLALVTNNAHCQEETPLAEAEPQIPTPCAEAMDKASAAFKIAFESENWKGVRDTATAAAKVCQDVRLAVAMLDTMRADSALRAGDSKDALEILKTPGVHADSAFWLKSQFVRIAALKEQGLQAEYLTVRDELVAATAAILTAGAEPFMTRIERFETTYMVVDAFEETPRGRALREVFFLASPKDGAMPVSVSVSFKMRGNKQHRPLGHMDMTYCQGNALMVLSKNARSYADLKAQATLALDDFGSPNGNLDSSEPIVSFKDGSGGLCPQASFIFRGLTPD